ncbi:hypothetical protein M0805_009647 [Coniferiporia weirii]|nr:hypothetical protein M0805_009647 [Coniferiporia weirii]
MSPARDATMDSSSSGRVTPLLSLRRKLVPYLSKASHFSAPFICSFLLVHLSAPLVAGLGGPSLSSKVMLLGREYYQGQANEILLVFAPIVVHVSASTLKRLISPISPRPTSSLLTIAGYAGALLLPLHALIHRFYPTDPTLPIASLGPAQLDFSFVQYALHTWPIRNTLFYAGLTSALIFHVIEGNALMWDLYLARPGAGGRFKKENIRWRRSLGAVGVVVSLYGLYSIWSEPLAMPLPSLLRRFDAIFRKSFIFQM